jgi:FdhD protein
MHEALSVDVWKWDGDEVTRTRDEVAPEAPLEIRVRQRSVCVTMRTPGHDDELAAGFLVSEGVVRGPENLASIAHCPFDCEGNTLNVVLAPQTPLDIERLTRHVFASSSCGLCGKATIESLEVLFPPVNSTARFESRLLATLPHLMRERQAGFDRTGGLHAAALFDTEGQLVVLREDVGRHNAVDKVIGHCLLQGIYPLATFALLISGRCSFEIVQKALAARIPLIAAISAPSSLAIELAQESGQTLIGFLRGGRMNVYTHPMRVIEVSA